MSRETPQLNFDEERLRERLSKLTFGHQLAFVASCCERAMPTCAEYADGADMQDQAQLASDVTELAWRGSLEPEARLQERSVANELWRFARMDNDWAKPMTRYVPDCVSVLYFAADFQLTGTVASASETARWIYNALDALVLNRSGITSGTGEESRALTADPTIQRELRKQERDLVKLEAAEHIDAPLLQVMRADSARLGRMMLEEFEADAQTRLRSGPPPRIWPDPPEGDKPSDL